MAIKFLSGSSPGVPFEVGTVNGCQCNVEVKSDDSHYRDSRAADGYTRECKACRKARSSLWQANHPETKNQYCREYYKRNRKAILRQKSEAYQKKIGKLGIAAPQPIK